MIDWDVARLAPTMRLGRFSFMLVMRLASGEAKAEGNTKGITRMGPQGGGSRSSTVERMFFCEFDTNEGNHLTMKLCRVSLSDISGLTGCRNDGLVPYQYVVICLVQFNST